MAANTGKKLDILNHKFDRAAFGYKADDVDDFLEEVASQMRLLTLKNSELESKVDLLTTKLEQYRSDEGSLSAALIGAQKLGDTVVREAKAKAEEILQEAECTAKGIVEASKRKVDSEKYTLTKLQKEVALFKSNLLSVYKQHLNLISTLPEYEDEEPQAPQTPQQHTEEPQNPAEATEESIEKAKDAPAEDSSEERRQNYHAQNVSSAMKFGKDYDISEN